MRQFLEDYIKKLDSIVSSSCLDNQNHELILHLQKNSYNLFLSQLKKQPVQDSQISQAISRMQFLLKQKLNLDLNLGKNSKETKKRGRPLKNPGAEKKLIEWIESQGRKQFTKKQLKRQLEIFQGKKIKALSTFSLMKILQRWQVSQISIITKYVGKQQQENWTQQIKIQNNQSMSNKSSPQIHERSENNDQSNKSFLLPFLNQEDSVLGMHYEFDDNEFELIFEKRDYS